MTTTLQSPMSDLEAQWGPSWWGMLAPAPARARKPLAQSVPAEPAQAPAHAQDAEELRLVQRAAAGDARAFECLYRIHVNRIHGLCCRLCGGDRTRAEQATQDAFVRAWERLSSFRGESRFGTWMHRLTVNVVLGEYRQLRRWVSFEEADTAEPDGRAEAANGHESTAERDLGSRVDLERALARLPKGARAVMVLHDIEGYPHEEIAALTGIAVGTSKAQLHRARRLLKEWLQ